MFYISKQKCGLKYANEGMKTKSRNSGVPAASGVSSTKIKAHTQTCAAEQSCTYTLFCVYIQHAIICFIHLFKSPS